MKKTIIIFRDIMEHLRFKGKIENVNGPFITIRCFDYKEGELFETGETNPMTGQKIVKRRAFTEVDIFPTGSLIQRKVRIIA